MSADRRTHPPVCFSAGPLVEAGAAADADANEDEDADADEGVRRTCLLTLLALRMPLLHACASLKSSNARFLRAALPPSVRGAGDSYTQSSPGEVE